MFCFKITPSIANASQVTMHTEKKMGRSRLLEKAEWSILRVLLPAWYETKNIYHHHCFACVRVVFLILGVQCLMVIRGSLTLYLKLFLIKIPIIRLYSIQSVCFYLDAWAIYENKNQLEAPKHYEQPSKQYIRQYSPSRQLSTETGRSKFTTVALTARGYDKWLYNDKVYIDTAMQFIIQKLYTDTQWVTIL